MLSFPLFSQLSLVLFLHLNVPILLSFLMSSSSLELVATGLPPFVVLFSFYATNQEFPTQVIKAFYRNPVALPGILIYLYVYFSVLLDRLEIPNYIVIHVSPSVLKVVLNTSFFPVFQGLNQQKSVGLCPHILLATPLSTSSILVLFLHSNETL